MRRATALAPGLLRLWSAGERTQAGAHAGQLLLAEAGPMARGAAAGLLPSPGRPGPQACKPAAARAHAAAAPPAPEAPSRPTQRGFSSAPARSAPEAGTSLAAELPEAGARKAKKGEALTAIQGVGKKYAAILEKAGLADLPAMRRWYLQQCARDEQRLLAELEMVGIKHKGHRARIADFLREQDAQQQAEQAAQAAQAAPRFTTLSVEGNISAGKSTFLQGISRHCPDLQNLLHVVPEPVDRWQNVGSHNLLGEFYQNKERFAYTFQNYIFFTRMMQERDSAAAMRDQPFRLLERSVFCDRMVFVESLRDSNILSPMELSIYDSWFDPVVSMAPTLVPDGFIYLRAQPDTCLSRLKNRARGEETAVDLAYLRDLHQRHDDWLYALHQESRPGMPQAFDASRDALGVRPELRGIARLVLEFETGMEPEVPDLIRADVKVLNKDRNSRLHASIHQLPALVLDCEADLGDLDAQREHAAKVNAYFGYVREKRERRMSLKPLVTSMEGSASEEEAKLRFSQGVQFLDPGLRDGVVARFNQAVLGSSLAAAGC